MLQVKQKNVNVKVFNMITRLNYSWNLSTCICENGKYLKSIADTLVGL